MAESGTAIVSREVAEASYNKFRAGSELKLTQEIEDWRAWIEADPPRMRISSESIDVRTDELDQHMVTSILWLRICAYLEAETLNRAALLLHRGICGHEAVEALRLWVEGLCDSARKYKWEPALSGIGIQDVSLNWPRENLCIGLTSRYEQAFWEAATNPDAVADLWNAAGWWEPQDAQKRTEQVVDGEPAASATSKSIDEIRVERRRDLDAYKAECRQAGIRINNDKMGQAMGYRGRTQVQKWLSASDPLYDATYDRKIRKVLLEKPHLPSHQS